ncbi:MAG TPA: DbpA RNA binding domain-containing protein [Gemmatimonadales bacterium]|nr:DbpA RNA binding domain-containing protein [Gemmatimonadales bacterium]
MKPELTIEGGVTSNDWPGAAPGVAERLTTDGWVASDEMMRQVLPAVARHGNAVVAVPPSPARAAPTLAGVLSAVAGAKGRALVLAAPALVEPLGQYLNELGAAAGLRVIVARGPGRATRHLAAGTVDVLVAAPAVTLALHTRSALVIDSITSVILAWPEDWDADEATTVLLGEIPRDAQRVLLAGDLTRVISLVERHIRRSLVVGYPALPADSQPAAPRSIRTIAAPWSGRVQALGTLLEILDPGALTVWTADPSHHGAIEAALREVDQLRIVSRGGVVVGPTLVCFDLPTPTELALLGADRDLILMATPGSEEYLRRLAPAARPVRETGMIDRLRDRDGVLRAEVVAAITDRDLTAASYVLAPLLERFDPQSIAAACYSLWRRDASAAPAPESRSEIPEPAPSTPVGGVATARIWVGAGRRDEATVGDFVALLIKDVGMTREAIGRIELRETFALVEVPAAEAERIARALSGLSIRRRRLTARVDKGSPGKPAGMRHPRR